MKNSYKVGIIVPVAPFEPFEIIQRSVDSVRSLNLEGLEARVIYVLDEIEDERLEWLEEQEDVEVIGRTSTRGRRAGAINDAIGKIKNLDYAAVFDVDSRPDPEFLVECVRELENNERAVIASGARYITNESAGVLPRVVAVEYRLFADFYRLFNWGDGFKQFNGLIGVLDAQVLGRLGLDERVACEDFDYTQRVYLEGYVAAFTKGARVGEQAPTNVKELFNQRVRWYTGAYEGLTRYFGRFIRSEIPASRRASWLAAVTLPFICAVFSPLVVFYVKRVWDTSQNTLDFMVRFLGTFFYAWLLQVCGITAVIKNLLGRDIGWKETTRTDV